MITAIAITITTVVLRFVISSYLLGYNRGRDGRKRNEQAIRQRVLEELKQEAQRAKQEAQKAEEQKIIRELAIEKLEQENKHDQI